MGTGPEQVAHVSTQALAVEVLAAGGRFVPDAAQAAGALLADADVHFGHSAVQTGGAGLRGPLLKFPTLVVVMRITEGTWKALKEEDG